jgi:low affinity Fe/Cu permease
MLARVSNSFDRIAHGVSVITGKPVVTVLSLVLVMAWFSTGEHYHWSDTWQLVIQTIATVITLPLLFILQSSHNREAEATQAKLDTIIALLEEHNH